MTYELRPTRYAPDMPTGVLVVEECPMPERELLSVYHGARWVADFHPHSALAFDFVGWLNAREAITKAGDIVDTYMGSANDEAKR